MVRQIAAICVLLVTACSTHEIRYVPMQCPDIPRPELPVVEEQALECLADEDYFDIQERDQLLRQYAEKHEQVCQAFEDLAGEAE